MTKSQKKRLRQQKKVFGELSEDEVDPPTFRHEVDSPIPLYKIDVIPPEENKSTSKVGVEPEPLVSKKKKKPRRNKTRNDVDKNSNPDPNPDSQESTNYCSTCRSQFASRNKLFKHLKTTGHSLPLNSSSHIKGSKLKSR